ncbi:hypothetical protein G3T36_18385 [Diaminobutyricibacter tongyongensis]|uniref:Uncharacterized protein n=1 Tax=Leifsonia tongyongensis TaxID=1268043 RepID=A0A6L9Y3K7_9MICO|nr:hypothetical protein [Diaminobutyricibacter tongyongensis]
MTDSKEVLTQARGFYAGVAAEFLGIYKQGPRFVAVTGVPRSNTAGAAEMFAEALREAGQDVQRVSAGDTGADRFRMETIAPFRSRDSVLVVDGPGLLDADFRGLWNFSLWVEHDTEGSVDPSVGTTEATYSLGDPREVASVLFDDTDPERPRRLWADSC